MLYPNIFLYVLDLFLWFVIFTTYSPALKKPFKITIKNRHFGLVFILLYILFSFWGDWFHYNIEVVKMLKGTGHGYEEVYNWLIDNICFHYIIFRIIVWWSAFILLWKTAKRFNINLNLMLLFLGCGWISLFAYARVTLAISILFYGYSLIATPNRHKIMNRCLGTVIIFSSFFFHKSSLFGIGMVLLGIVLSRLNKKMIIGLLILIPLLVSVIGNYLTLFMMSGASDYDSSLQVSVMAGQEYLQKSSVERGWGAIIRSFFENSAYFLMAILCILTLTDRKAEKMDKNMRTLSLICLIIIVCSSLFMLDFGFNTKILAIRFLRFSVIPILLLMSYFYQIGFYRKIVKLVFISTCCMTIYGTLYTMYLCHIGKDLVNM